MAEWGRLHPELARELGYVGSKTPCAATFCRLFALLDWQAFVAVLQQWAEAWMQPLEERASKAEKPPPHYAALALDGKTHRGSCKRGGVDCHVLTAVFHDVGLTLAEAAVDDKTNEIPVAMALLKQLRLQGRVVTMDALLTQREIATVIVERGGDYIMPVKENHESVHHELHRLFRCTEHLEVSLSTAETVEKSRGRVETRRLTAMSTTEACGERGFDDYFAWPGLRQVYRLEREVCVLRTGTTSVDVEVGFASLPPDKADAEVLLTVRRGHWQIENWFHYVRDVTYDEDRSQVRCGRAPQVHGTLRNLAISLCRRHGMNNIAQANREIAARPQRALAWLGLSRS